MKCEKQEPDQKICEAYSISFGDYSKEISITVKTSGSFQLEQYLLGNSFGVTV